MNGKVGNDATATTMTFSITTSPHCETTETSIKLSIASKSPTAAETMFTANVSLGGGGGGDGRNEMHASVHVSSVTRHRSRSKSKLNRDTGIPIWSPHSRNAKLAIGTDLSPRPQERKDTFFLVATVSQSTEPFEVQSYDDNHHRSERVVLPAHGDPIVEGPSSSPVSPISPRVPPSLAVAPVAPVRPPLVAHWSADTLN